MKELNEIDINDLKICELKVEMYIDNLLSYTRAIYLDALDAPGKYGNKNILGWVETEMKNICNCFDNYKIKVHKEIDKK